eukprot:TRINITY_DN482_c0_g1_i1.p1 TRINITY_DN482_c0_g1~~TRINITY_DN482_c0_g1_i1.p1  ORF type:complete len:222 (-),score=100.64 TRINITY_DN482_c0_g1_i1:664-1329(-)
MPKTESEDLLPLSPDEELLIRPFKKLKVSRLLGELKSEEGKSQSSVKNEFSSSPCSPWSSSSSNSSCSCSSPSSSSSSLRGPRLKPSRLTSVQNTNLSEEKREEEDFRERKRESKDIHSHIIRRFDTISLSGYKRKKKRSTATPTATTTTAGSSLSPSTSHPESQEEKQSEASSTQAQLNCCATQARQSYNDVSVDDLAGYLENSMVFPKKMSYMAEMMYT